MAARRRSTAKPRKACCMVSEMLEEMGLDRERTRALRRQVLQGVMLMCQWQLERMEEAPRPRRRRARRVEVD